MRLQLSPTGRYVIAIYDSGEEQLWDNLIAAPVLRAARLSPSAGPGRDVFGIPRVQQDVSARTPIIDYAFGPLDALLVTARSDGQVSLWGLNLMQHPTLVTMIGISPAVNEGMLGHAEIARIVHGHTLAGMRMSPDARRILTLGSSVIRTSGLPIPGTGRDAARLWDTFTQRELARLIPETSLTAATFSPDGAYLASAFENTGTVQLWRATNRVESAEHRPLQPKRPAAVSGEPATDWSRMANGADMTPDATLLAVASSDGILHLHDLDRGEDRLSFPLDMSSVSHGPDPDLSSPLCLHSNVVLSLDGRGSVAIVV